MSKEVRVGLLFVISIAVFVFGYKYLQGKKFWQKQNQYYALFENVEGLTVSDPVLIKGIPIGKVTNLELVSENQRILASIELEEKIKVPENSTAILYSVDILGDKSIRLILGKKLEYLSVGDTISTEIEKELIDELGSKITPVTEQINNFIPTLDTTLNNVNRIFDRRRQNSLPNVMAELNDVLVNIKDITGEMKEVLEDDGSHFNQAVSNIDKITAVFSKNSSSIEKTLRNLEALSDTLNDANIGQVVQKTNKVMVDLKSTLDSINKGKGSMASLINDPAMYNNLESATGNLDKLLLDIRENPGRYVTISLFGGGKKE